MRMPMELRITVDGSGVGTAVETAVNEPESEVVILLPEVKSAVTHVPAGQKYSWIFWGVGAVPFGRSWDMKSENPPL
jgi:hypothetical protein